MSGLGLNTVSAEQGLVVPGDIVSGRIPIPVPTVAWEPFSTGVGSTDLAVGMAMGEICSESRKALRLY